MRKLGVAFAGPGCGLLVGFVAQEIIARIAVFGTGQPPDSLVLGLLLGFIVAALAVVGAAVALVVAGNRARRPEGRARR